MLFYPQKSGKPKIVMFFLTRYFQNFHKNVQHVEEPCLGMYHAKFQVDMSIFGKPIGQKSYSLIQHFLQTSILSISRHRTELKMTFLES